MNRMADMAQIESEDVAADNVRRTGDSEIRERNIIMADFKAFRSEMGRVKHSNAM